MESSNCASFVCVILERFPLSEITEIFLPVEFEILPLLIVLLFVGIIGDLKTGVLESAVVATDCIFMFGVGVDALLFWVIF